MKSFIIVEHLALKSRRYLLFWSLFSIFTSFFRHFIAD